MMVCIDLGTSSVKGAVFLDTRPLRFLGRFVYKKQDVASWLQAVEKLLLSLTWAERADIESIVISGQGPTLVPVLADERVLKPLFYYEGDRALPADGKPVQSYFLPKIAAFMQKKGSAGQMIRHFMNAPDYIAYWLTGQAVTSLPNEAYRDLIWSEEEIERYGFKQAWFAPYAMHQEVGLVHKELREQWYLQRKVNVYTTMFDFLSALLGSGSMQEGDVLDRAGMSEGINFITDQIPPLEQLPQTTAPWRISPHILPNLYNVGVVFNDVGALLQQYNYSLEEPEVQLHLAKVTRIWNEMQAIKVKQIRLCGGQSYNQAMNQFKQQLSHYPMYVLAYPETELMGNAMYGAWLRGYYESLQQSVEQLLHNVAKKPW